MNSLSNRLPSDLKLTLVVELANPILAIKIVMKKKNMLRLLSSCGFF